MNTDVLDEEELFALARLEFEKEHFDQALVHLKRAAAIENDQYPEIWGLMGATYAKLRLWTKAQAALSKFLQLRPEALHERFQMGMTFFDAGDNEKALEIWQQVLARQATHPPALYFSAVISSRLGQVERALEFCNTVLVSSAKDNLFHGRAKDLAETLKADPRFQRSTNPTPEVGDATPKSRKKH